jgi:hypothetical protein
MKITRRQLRRIIKEEKQGLLSEQDHQMYEEDDELRALGDFIGDLHHYSMEVDATMKDMGMRYGELVHLGTQARKIEQLIRELGDNFDRALDDIVRYR